MEMESTVSIPAKIRVHDCFCSVDGFDSGGVEKNICTFDWKEEQGKAREKASPSLFPQAA